MIQGSHDDSLILWIRKQIIQTHETHIRHCHSYLKIRRKKLFLDFFLNKTSEDIQCSLRWFHRNLLGWPLWSPSISSIESVKVSAAEVEDEERWTELWFEAGPPRSPSPRQWGEANRGERLLKSCFLWNTWCISWNIDIGFFKQIIWRFWKIQFISKSDKELAPWTSLAFGVH